MSAQISLAEAASLLGVSKETLRNWDKTGKLKPVRNPDNNYRMYELEKVQRLVAEQTQSTYQVNRSLFEGIPNFELPLQTVPADTGEKDFKRALSRVHRALRDTDGSSSIIERFDEVTKLVFLKLYVETHRPHDKGLGPATGETGRAYARRLRELYRRSAQSIEFLIPEKFLELRLSDAALQAVASILSEVDLKRTNQDLKGFAYEEMIRNTFDKGDNQQFFTPQPVVEFLVALMGDRLRGSICDPACGTGGFLVEVAKQASKYKELIGFEIDDRLAWVTGINLFVHGAKNFHTYCFANGGTLGASGRPYFNKYDAIVTNPPFGSDFTDVSQLEAYVLGRGKTSRRRGVLFLERCLDLLKDDGWLGIVIDEGVLSLPSAADVRELLRQRAQMLAVVSLPETAFMPYASVNTSILLLRKRARPLDQQVTFYARVDNVGRKANGDVDIVYDETGAARLNSDLPNILAAWREFERTHKIVHQTDNLFLANPYRLFDELSTDVGRLDFRFHHPTRSAAVAALEASEYPVLELSEVCDVRNETCVPSVDYPDQVIQYTGLAQIESRTGRAQQIPTATNSLTSGVRRYERGDVLFARMRPNLRKVAFVDFEDPGYASAECVVLVARVKDGVEIVDPFLLSILMRSDYAYGQIIHHIAGIGRPRITLKDLLAIKVPVPPREHQLALRDRFLKAKAEIERVTQRARDLEKTASRTALEAIERVANGFVRKRSNAR